MTETLIATRKYDLDGYQFTDRMLRVGEAFRLERSVGGHPQEQDDRVGYSLAECFEWLRDQPQQVERGVIGAFANGTANVLQIHL